MSALTSTSIRMPRKLLDDLKALAATESARRGRCISWSRLVRASATKLVRAAKERVTTGP